MDFAKQDSHHVYLKIVLWQRQNVAGRYHVGILVHTAWWNLCTIYVNAHQHLSDTQLYGV